MDTFLYQQFADIDRRHWWFVARREIIASVLRKRFAERKPERLLDVGCGTGGLLETLSGFVGEAWGIDSSPEAIAACEQRGLPNNVHLHLGSLPNAMPPGIEAWDAITSFDVVEHLDDDRAMLSDIYRTLKPGGVFICTVPAFMFLWGPHDDLAHHKRRYSRAELKARLVEAGFVVEKLTYFNALLFPIVAGVRVGRRLVSFGKECPPKSDFTMPSPLVNTLLTRFFALEAPVVAEAGFPFGVSLLAVCRRPLDAQM